MRHLRLLQHLRRVLLLALEPRSVSGTPLLAHALETGQFAVIGFPPSLGVHALGEFGVGSGRIVPDMKVSDVVASLKEKLMPPLVRLFDTFGQLPGGKVKTKRSKWEVVRSKGRQWPIFFPCSLLLPTCYLAAARSTHTSSWSFRTYIFLPA